MPSKPFQLEGGVVYYEQEAVAIFAQEATEWYSLLIRCIGPVEWTITVDKKPIGVLEEIQYQRVMPPSVHVDSDTLEKWCPHITNDSEWRYYGLNRPSFGPITKGREVVLRGIGSTEPQDTDILYKHRPVILTERGIEL